MPKDQTKTGWQNYDWAKIQHEYVTDPQMSLRRIAEKYGINYKTVAKKSKAEGWFATRKKSQSRVVSRAISQTEKKMAKELSQEADFLALMKGHVGRMLQDEDQFRRHIVQGGVDENFETKEIVADKVDARSMKDAMQVLRMIEEMTRSLYNIQKAEQLNKQQIERERLELERERFEFEKEKAEFMKPDTSNAIRIEGFEKGWDE